MHINPFRLLITLKLALLTLVLGVSHPLQAAPTEFPAVGPLGFTSRVSVDSNGTEGDNFSSAPSISADGRYVAFSSDSSNLVPGDTNGYSDVFVHDRETGITTRVSVSSTGVQATSTSFNPAISGDGRFVAFESFANNLVTGDTNGQRDIFVHDRDTGETTRVSVASGGVQATGGGSFSPSLSFNGEFVAFHSNKTDLVADDTNNAADVFIHNRTTGNTIRVSVDALGNEANGPSNFAMLSANGQFVVFGSDATNLVPDDTNNATDIFVRNRQNNTVTRVSVSTNGEEANRESYAPAISGNGRFVVFASNAQTLIDGEPIDPDLDTQVYLHDRVTGITTRISENALGNPANGGSTTPSITDDGTYVVFDSLATNLIFGGTSGTRHIFLHHVPTSTTALASLNNAGIESDRQSYLGAIAQFGRYITYFSDGRNLVPDDLNDVSDVFVFTLAFPVYLPTLQR